MALPLQPPIPPQLAKSSKELPEGDGWVYEPKFDGFRTIVFRDGDDVHLQSRNGKPMNRYFPEVVEAVRSMERDRLVMDGEIIVVVDGDEVLMDLPYSERRARLEAAIGAPIELSPMTDDRDAAGVWLTGTSEGVV